MSESGPNAPVRSLRGEIRLFGRWLRTIRTPTVSPPRFEAQGPLLADPRAARTPIDGADAILNNLVVIGTFGLYIAIFGVSKDLTTAQLTPGQILLIGGGTLLGVVVQAVGLAPALRKVPELLQNLMLP